MVSWGNLADRLEQWAASKYALSAANYFSTGLMRNCGVDAFFSRGDAEGLPSDVLEWKTCEDVPGLQDAGGDWSALQAKSGADSWMWTRSRFRSPVMTFTACNMDKYMDWGFASYGSRLAGIVYFSFPGDGTVEGQLRPRGMNVGQRDFKVTDYYSYDPDDQATYTIVVRRASVEYWVRSPKFPGGEGRLAGIIQCSPMPGESSYDVRDGSPYYVGQVHGELPTPMPGYIHVKEGAAFRLDVHDGGEGRQRHLQPITSNSRWAGTSIDAGTLTSDGIPCLGFDKIHVYFIADGSGTLDLNVDYGFNSYDQYDSISVSANSLENYIITGRIPWLQLEFTPDAYPTTVTRAMVVME